MTSEIWVFVCHDCGTFGAAAIGVEGVNEYFDDRVAVHSGHDWEICGDDECRRVHWGNWSHDRMVRMLLAPGKFPAVSYFGNF